MTDSALLQRCRAFAEALYASRWLHSSCGSHSHHGPGWHLPRGPFVDYDLHVIITGSMHYDLPEEGCFVAQAGDALLFGPGQEWIESVPGEAETGVELIANHFRVLRDEEDVLSVLRTPFHLRGLLAADPESAHLVASLTPRGRRDRRRSPFKRLLQRGVTMGLIGRCIEYAMLNGQTDLLITPPDPVEQARLAAERHFAEPDFGVEDMAKAAELSPAHFSREFKRHLGVPPRRFLQQVRFRHAAMLLDDQPDASVATVAERCGFSDPFHFSRCFKRFHNCTPSQWRLRG